MTKPTGVSRRINQCIAHLQAKDWEGALVNLFPALDQTAKRRRSKDGVGSRIRAFIEDEEGLISCIATGNFIANVNVQGVSITDALYKFGRTSIAHEGELDPRLNFNEGGQLVIGNDRWDLPVGYIFGMAIAVIVAPENAEEVLPAKLSATIMGEQRKLNELWGKRDTIRQFISAKFRNPNLFDARGHGKHANSP
jgi:hypothetical protein